MNLLKCYLEERYFEFEGNIEFEDTGNQDCPYVNFYELEIYEIKGEHREKFEPQGYTWSGAEIDCYYAINDVLGRYSRNESGGFVMLFLCDSLKELYDKYKEDIAITIGDLHVPKKILFGSGPDIYDLALVTDKYIYYAYEDQFLMLDSKDGTIISDNYFAEVGCWNSLEEIHKGNEQLLLNPAQFPLNKQ